LQFPSFADRLETAVKHVVAEGKFKTKDLGGDCTTQQGSSFVGNENKRLPMFLNQHFVIAFCFRLRIDEFRNMLSYFFLISYIFLF
jgi:hypothetical protein